MNTTITIPERDLEHERVLGIVFHTSPVQSSVLSCLLRVPMATSDELLEYTGSKTPSKVAISRARSRLQEHGYDIKSRVGAGYWIEAEDKKGIERLVSNFVEGK